MDFSEYYLLPFKALELSTFQGFLVPSDSFRRKTVFLASNLSYSLCNRVVVVAIFFFFGSKCAIPSAASSMQIAL